MAEGGLRRASGRALRTIGLASVFVVAAAGGIVVHANLPLTRQLIARTLSAVLSDVLTGEVRIETLGLVSLTQVTTPSAVLYDSAGHQVLALKGVRIDASLRTVLRDLLTAQSRMRVIVDHLRVERADVDLIPDPVSGEPTIVRAISPTTTEPSPTQDSSSAAGTRVFLPAIEIGRVVGHARFKDQPPLEGDVRRVRGQLLASPKGVAVDVERFGAILRGYGTEARGTGTLSVRAPGPVRGSFEGFLGDIELKATALIRDRHLEISADVPGASPAAISRMLPGWPVRDPVSGRVELTGDFPELTGRARLTMGPATVDASGPVHLGGEPHADLDVAAHHVDLRSLLDGAPTTDMDAVGGVRIFVDQGRLVVDARAHTEKTTFLVGGQAPAVTAAPRAPPTQTKLDIPAMDLTASFRDTGASGTSEIHERGLPLHATFKVSPEGVVDVDATSATADLASNVHTSSLGLAGRGRARAHVHVGGGKLAVTVGADIARFSGRGSTAREMHVQADAQGPLASLTDLRGTVRVQASGLAVSGVTAERVSLTARGNRRSAAFDLEATGGEGVSGSARGKASLDERIVLRGTRVALRRGALTLEGDIAELDPERAVIEVPEFRLTGAGGTMKGSVTLRPGLVEGSASGADLDLAALATALSLPPGSLTGKARIDADLTAGHDVTRGWVRVGLGNVSVRGLSGVSLAASAKLDGERLTGEASGLVSTFAKVGATWDLTLGGPAFQLSSFRDVTGEGELQVTDADLSTLNRLLPQDAPIRDVKGLGYARLRFSRKVPSAPLPGVLATLATRGLAFAVARSAPEGPKPVSGMDVDATVGLDGTSGNTNGAALLSDPHGDLTKATFAIRIDPVTLRKDPKRAVAELQRTPIDLVLSLPPRAVSDLPPFLEIGDLAGTVSGSLTLGGSLVEPTLSAQLSAIGLGPRKTRPDRAVDVQASGSYQWNTHDVVAHADTALGGRHVGAVDVRAVLPDAELSRWVGEARATVDGLPLDVLPPFEKNDFHGRVSGTALLSRGGETPDGQKVAADLRILDAMVSGTPLGTGQLTLRSRGASLDAELGLLRGDERLTVTATAGYSWVGLLPAPSEDEPARLHAIARRFAAGALAPFLEGVASRVAGHVDADVTVQATPTHAEGHPTRWDETVNGAATLGDGTALIDLLGVEVRDLGATVEADGTAGRTHIAVRDVRGKVRSPADNLRGAADFWLSGVRVKSGTVSLNAEDVPLLFRGAPQGRARGTVQARLTREPELMLVDLEIPRLTVKLPQSSARNVIDLSENPDITIIQLAGKEGTSGESLPWRLAFHLGRDVSIRRSDIDLNVTGRPVLDLGGEPMMSGAVDLVPGGRVPVLGKVFNIDHGRVIFDTGENANPRLDVTAVWRAQNDVAVYVEVTGTLRDAKLHLRSDPPLPEPEVFALLLGGSSGDRGTERSAPGSQAAGAVALGSGVGVLGVNELLSDSPLELRIDTTAQSRPRYTASVRVRPNLWFEASTYQQSQQTEGAASDRNVVSGTIDYRFTPRWSLRTEAGTSGGALDLLWQYRY